MIPFAKYLVPAAGLFCVAADLFGVELRSPDGLVASEVNIDANSNLVYSLRREGHSIVSPSRMGITIDGIDLGRGVMLGKPEISEVSEKVFPPTGPPPVELKANTLVLPARNTKSGVGFTIEAQASNDGFAWRLLVSGSGEHRIQGEASSWRFPDDSQIWFGKRNSPWKLRTYAGEFRSAPFHDLGKVSPQGLVQCPPLLAELPANAGFALVTEAALANYSGLRLRSNPEAGLQADFSEGEKGFAVSGPVTTPWRVILAVPNLDRLVNSVFIASLNPPPDPPCFPTPTTSNPAVASGVGGAKARGRPPRNVP